MPMPMPTPPEDRAVRTLSDALDGARARLPEDSSDPTVPVAGTLLPLRDGADGLEVLMLERPDRGSFAGAWVFPGGKIEPGDRDSSPDDADAEESTARRAAVRETHEECGLVVDPDGLVTLSCWDPPPGLKLRIRTWFFVAPDPGGALVLAPDEVETAEWVRPAEMLTRHGRGEATLYPPTWVTLHGLAQHPDVESVLGAARIAGVERFETVARRGGEGPMLLWQGDAAYEADADEEAEGARHRLEIGALPWRYLRD